LHGYTLCRSIDLYRSDFVQLFGMDRADSLTCYICPMMAPLGHGFSMQNIIAAELALVNIDLPLHIAEQFSPVTSRMSRCYNLRNEHLRRMRLSSLLFRAPVLFTAQRFTSPNARRRIRDHVGQRVLALDDIWRTVRTISMKKSLLMSEAIWHYCVTRECKRASCT
jgi:hypothetical protein